MSDKLCGANFQAHRRWNVHTQQTDVWFCLEVLTHCPAVLGIRLVKLVCRLSLSHHLQYHVPVPLTPAVLCPHAAPVLKSYMSLRPVKSVLVCVPDPILVSTTLTWAVMPHSRPAQLRSSSISGATWCRLVWTGRARCERPPARFKHKHKHLKHFSCAATRQCMQLKTIGPLCICIPLLRGNVRWNSVIL